MMKNKQLNWVILTGMILCILGGLTGCGQLKASREKKLAAEIAAISTEIQGTLQAERTPSVTATPQPTATETATPLPPTATATEIIPPTETPLPGTSTPDVRPSAEDWRNWPILPTLSDTAKRIYYLGIRDFKTNPHVFSKIGDCQSRPNVFLGIYDMGYAGLFGDEDIHLQKAVDYFKGSFALESYAVHDGMGVGSVLTTTWADQKACKEGENSLDCEIRMHNPSIMFINLGTNWISGLGMDVYEEYLTEIVQKLVNQGILPILSSKADDVEGGHQINQVTAKVARAFDVPFFNFWRAAQSLKNGGLSEEKPIYLSVAAWDYRNYQALQLLYSFGVELGLF